MSDTSIPEPEASSASVAGPAGGDAAAALISKLQRQQNMPRAVIAGLLAAVVGAAIWAGVTYLTGYQIGWMAVGVGFLVGYGIRIMGKGVEQRFGYVGAAFALFGCLLGNLLTQAAFIADYQGVSMLDVLLALDAAFITEIFTVSFSPMDLLFYGIAIYEGFKFSFAQLDESQLSALGG